MVRTCTQIALKNHAAITTTTSQPALQLLQQDHIPIKRDYTDTGRLIIAFDTLNALRARDVVDASLADSYSSALS